MTSTNKGPQIGGYRREVDYQKLGPALLIASSLVLAIRTARCSPTTSDCLAHVESEKMWNTVFGLRRLCSHIRRLGARSSFKQTRYPGMSPPTKRCRNKGI